MAARARAAPRPGGRQEPQAPPGNRAKPTSAGGGLWEDLLDAWPGLPVPASALKAGISMVAVLVIYGNLHSLRVENGSADSCDPITTYGEISADGMRSLVGAAASSGGNFLDVGSGAGAFALWACTEGGFRYCAGVEVQRDRHEAAQRALRAAGSAPNVSLLLGDALEHQALFDGVSLAYWNNLCFPSDAAASLAARFARRAPVGAELFTLAALPPQSGIRGSQPELRLKMDWRDEPYRPYRYTRVAADAGAEA